MENIMIITKHGGERIIERTQCKRKNIEEFLLKVWNEGKAENFFDNKTAVRKYLKNVKENSGADRSVRVKGNVVYIFNYTGNVFVTCYEIPQKVLQDKRNRR